MTIRNALTVIYRAELPAAHSEPATAFESVLIADPDNISGGVAAIATKYCTASLVSTSGGRGLTGRSTAGQM